MSGTSVCPATFWRKGHAWSETRLWWSEAAVAATPCRLCGITRREDEIERDWYFHEQVRMHRDAPLQRCMSEGYCAWHGVAQCPACRTVELKERAWMEQARIRTRLREDLEEVSSLYGQSVWAMRDYGTPDYWRERYPKWRAEREARQETARQRRRLREGQQALTAMRKHLAAPRSQRQASGPETTSPTS